MDLLQVLSIVENYRKASGHAGTITKVEYKDEYTILITYTSMYGPYVWTINIRYLKEKVIFINEDLIKLP